MESLRSVGKSETMVMPASSIFTVLIENSTLFSSVQCQSWRCAHPPASSIEAYTVDSPRLVGVTESVRSATVGTEIRQL